MNVRLLTKYTMAYYSRRGHRWKPFMRITRHAILYNFLVVQRTPNDESGEKRGEREVSVHPSDRGGLDGQRSTRWRLRFYRCWRARHCVFRYADVVEMVTSSFEMTVGMKPRKVEPRDQEN